MPHNHNQMANSILIQITYKKVSSKDKFSQHMKKQDVTVMLQESNMFQTHKFLVSCVQSPTFSRPTKSSYLVSDIRIISSYLVFLQSFFFSLLSESNMFHTHKFLIYCVPDLNHFLILSIFT